MKEMLKNLGIIAIVAIIGLSMAACGGDDNPAHTCSFGNWTKISDATCVAKEKQERSCSCGVKQTQEVGEKNLDAHSFTIYTPNNDAVCEGEDGTKTSICDRVGCEVPDTVTDIGSALQHVFSIIPATCTTPSIPGTCTRTDCDVISPEAVVQALGHDHASSLTCKRTGCDHQYELGDTGPAGGIIFYVAPAGFTMTDDGSIAYYLEAAPANMATTLRWSTLTWQEYVDSGYNDSLWLDIPGTETIGTGRENTALILVLDPTAPAALACKNYFAIGYESFNDWFLPSRDELNAMYIARAAPNNVAGLPTTSDFFWSSSRNYDGNAWLQRFDDGGQTYGNKSGGHYVRAVRAF